MSRRIGAVAWVVAAALSVAVSTAAVASVRDRVTDRPGVVSLATLRRATSTTTSTTSPTPTQALAGLEPTTTTSTTVVDTTTTTREPVVATPDTVVETTTTTSTTTAAPTVSESGSEVETRDFRGGKVTVSFDGNTIELLEAVPDDGYQVSVEEDSDRRINLRFNREGRSTGFIAQVVNGRLEFRVVDGRSGRGNGWDRAWDAETDGEWDGGDHKGDQG